MGTRGTWGFVLNDEEKFTYNHFDSYPEGLGTEILKFCEGLDLDATKKAVAELRLVDQDATPSPEEAERFRESTDTRVSTGTDWYSTLRDLQGDPAGTLKAGVMTDGGEFWRDGLFCEWGYVIDLDTGFLEVYEGFHEEPHTAGRFGARSKVVDGYQPIKMISAFSLTELPTEEEFTKQVIANSRHPEEETEEV